MNPDKHVEAVRQQLLERSQVGPRKYGVTTERQDLTRLDWIRHAQQEAMDLAVYLQVLIEAENPCAWTYLEADEVWLTACGTERHFEDGKPGEYGVKFCPACGKPLGLPEEVVSKKPSVINGCIVFENPELPDAQ